MLASGAAFETASSPHAWRPNKAPPAITVTNASQRIFISFTPALTKQLRRLLITARSGDDRRAALRTEPRAETAEHCRIPEVDARAPACHRPLAEARGQTWLRVNGLDDWLRRS